MAQALSYEDGPRYSIITRFGVIPEYNKDLIFFFIYTKNSAAPASDYEGRVVKAETPVITYPNQWAGDTSLVGAGVGSNSTRNQIFLITFSLTSWLVRFKRYSLSKIFCLTVLHYLIIIAS